MNIAEDESLKIKEFEEYCNDVVSGKYLLSDVKIKRILKSIANSKELMTYLAECLLNFDYEKEFAKAKGVDFTNNYFKMPEEPYKKVALVFCFLVDVDNKDIDLQSFLDKYFKKESSSNSFKEFCKTMLVPFKVEILKHFDMFEEPEYGEIEESEEEVQVKSIKGELVKQIQSMMNVAKISPKIKDDVKERISLMLEGVLEAVKINNKKILFALEVALVDVMKKAKPLKDMYNDLLNLLFKFYNE